MLTQTSHELPGFEPQRRFSKCRRCNRALKSIRSQQLGYGTVCARLVGASSKQENGTMDRELDSLPSEPWSADVRVWRDGNTGEPCGASIPRSVIWHSPDGFNFGYGGSGPADLALNILNAFVPPQEVEVFDDTIRDTEPVKCFKGTCSQFAARHHQAFKSDFIATMGGNGGTIPAATIRAWIDARRSRAG